MHKYRVRARTLRANKTDRADFQKRPYRGDRVKSIDKGRFLENQEDISFSDAEESKKREYFLKDIQVREVESSDLMILISVRIRGKVPHDQESMLA